MKDKRILRYTKEGAAISKIDSSKFVCNILRSEPKFNEPFLEFEYVQKPRNVSGRFAFYDAIGKVSDFHHPTEEGAYLELVEHYKDTFQLDPYTVWKEKQSEK